jgi:hypothetical protein
LKQIFKHNNDVCAVKCIKRSSLTETSTENLLREIEILKNIRNDHIVPLKDFQVLNFKWNFNLMLNLIAINLSGTIITFI